MPTSKTITSVTPEAVRTDMERGCTLVTAGIDTLFLGKAAAEMLSQVKS